MFQNFIKTAFRNIQRYKGYSLINIVGLALGMACCILILLWAKDELATDKYHLKLDSLYTVHTITHYGGEFSRTSGSVPGLAPAWINYYPRILFMTQRKCLCPYPIFPCTPPETGLSNETKPGRGQSARDVGDDTVPPWRENGLKKRAKDNPRREQEELRPGSQNQGQKASTGVIARCFLINSFYTAHLFKKIDNIVTI